jgi:hypothetical protein
MDRVLSALRAFKALRKRGAIPEGWGFTTVGDIPAITDGRRIVEISTIGEACDLENDWSPDPDVLPILTSLMCYISENYLKRHGGA